MGIQLFTWEENIVGKGEIARYEQFLLFPQCFEKQSVVDVLKNEYLWSKGLKQNVCNSPHHTHSFVFFCNLKLKKYLQDSEPDLQSAWRQLLLPSVTL